MRPETLHVIVLTRAVAPFHGAGGLERHGYDLVRHLLRRGVRVTLITRQPRQGTLAASDLGDTPRLRVRFVPYLTFPFAGRLGTTAVDRSTAYPVFGWRAGRLAAALVRAGGVHLVHGMGAASLGYARARAGDWFGTVPFVFNPHGMEEFGSTGPRLGGLKHWVYAPLRKAVRICARSADRIVATDHALVPVVMRHLGISDARVRVVPNAVDLEEIDRLTSAARGREIRRNLGLDEDDLLLVGVGRLEESKGYRHLIAALARLTRNTSLAGLLGSRWRCVLLGEGPYRGSLERAVASAGLTRSVLLPGRVTGTDLHAWYEAATLFVHPTLYEGSSIVTLEAMAHRRPVVATFAGGLPDKIRPGLNGWLVEPGSAEALAHGLSEALARRSELRAMGESGRAVVEREFAWNAVIETQLALYEEVLSEPKRPPSL